LAASAQALIASATVVDLTTKNLAFDGFPRVQMSLCGMVFQVTPRVDEAVAEPFNLDEQPPVLTLQRPCAKFLVKTFRLFAVTEKRGDGKTGV